MGQVEENSSEAFDRVRAEIARAASADLMSLDLDFPQYRRIRSLPSEIGKLRELRTLELKKLPIDSLRPIATLVRLRSLDASETAITSLAGLSSLKRLRELHLNRTAISDISELASMVSLKALHLNGTQVRDLAPLAGLPKLEILGLDNTIVEDLTPLAGISSLTRLFLSGTSVRHIEPLRNLTALRIIDLENTNVVDLLPLRLLSNLTFGEDDGLCFSGTPASARDDIHGQLAQRSFYPCAQETLLFLNGNHPEFGGPPEPWRPLDPYEFAKQDQAGIRYAVEGYELRIDMHSDPPGAQAEKLLPEFRDSVEDLIDTFENPNSVMARGILRRAKRMRDLLTSEAMAIAEDAVVLWQISVALGSYLDEHALAVADGADPLDRLSASRMGALQRVIEASSIFVRLFPAAEALDDSRGGFLRDKFGPDRVRAFIDQTTRAQVLDEQSALFIKGLAEIAARQGPQADKARSVTMTGIGTLIRIVTHYGKGAITGIALGVGASIGAEIDDEFRLGINAAQMLRDGEQEVRAILADLAPDVRNAVRGTIEEIFGSDVPLPPTKPSVH